MMLSDPEDVDILQSVLGKNAVGSSQSAELTLEAPPETPEGTRLNPFDLLA